MKIIFKKECPGTEYMIQYIRHENYETTCSLYREDKTISPVVKGLLYDDENQVFNFHDQISALGRPINIYFTLDASLQPLGCLYDDYFDAMHSFLSSSEHDAEKDFFGEYLLYKERLEKAITEDIILRQHKNKECRERILDGLNGHGGTDVLRPAIQYDRRTIVKVPNTNFEIHRLTRRPDNVEYILAEHLALNSYNTLVSGVNKIEYDCDRQLFSIEDSLVVNDMRINLYFNLDLALNYVGFIYNDYFTNLENVASDKHYDIAAYLAYLSDLAERIDEDLKHRVAAHEENQRKFILAYGANRGNV